MRDEERDWYLTEIRRLRDLLDRVRESRHVFVIGHIKPTKPDGADFPAGETMH